MKRSCVHIYTGDGKGKSTASVGLCVRAAGQEKRVGFFQFLKSGLSGEIISLAKLGVEVYAPQCRKFIWEMDDAERADCTAQQQDTLARAEEMMNQFDLLVLDEVVCAMDAGMVSLEDLTRLVDTRPEGLELVFTGRGATEELMALADYVTEMKMIAHPFQQGIDARRGIEF